MGRFPSSVLSFIVCLFDPILGLGPDHKDNMIEALPTLKDRLQKGDPNVLYSVVNDLSKVPIFSSLNMT